MAVTMNEQEKPLLHNFPSVEKTTVPLIPVLVGGVILIIAGIFTGYTLVKPSAGSSSNVGSTEQSDTRKLFGTTDEKSFRDSAEGSLETGGLDGEGTHKLIRPGGDSQTVYLTSSVLDLNQFSGKKVRVWGETFAAKTAGWFMDVGRLEVIE